MEGTWRLLKRHTWSWQRPARRAIERDDEAIEAQARRPPDRGGTFPPCVSRQVRPRSPARSCTADASTTTHTASSTSWATKTRLST
ncbi:winged helix-turn-helix domain-containing protein [Streptomyces sp. NPDC053726]|uniref:winged helix-turn-helix domain-containing protein n=1 Tax=Streptomyces sp. NPDC053726 TaxID=3365713 RepID=UPI0037D3DBB1